MKDDRSITLHSIEHKMATNAIQRVTLSKPTTQAARSDRMQQNIHGISIVIEQDQKPLQQQQQRQQQHQNNPMQTQTPTQPEQQTAKLQQWQQQLRVEKKSDAKESAELTELAAPLLILNVGGGCGDGFNVYSRNNNNNNHIKNVAELNICEGLTFKINNDDNKHTSNNDDKKSHCGYNSNSNNNNNNNSKQHSNHFQILGTATRRSDDNVQRSEDKHEFEYEHEHKHEHSRLYKSKEAIDADADDADDDDEDDNDAAAAAAAADDDVVVIVHDKDDLETSYATKKQTLQLVECTTSRNGKESGANEDGDAGADTVANANANANAERVTETEKKADNQLLKINANACRNVKSNGKRDETVDGVLGAADDAVVVVVVVGTAIGGLGADADAVAVAGADADGDAAAGGDFNLEVGQSDSFKVKSQDGSGSGSNCSGKKEIVQQQATRDTLVKCDNDAAKDDNDDEKATDIEGDVAVADDRFKIGLSVRSRSLYSTEIQLSDAGTAHSIGGSASSASASRTFNADACEHASALTETVNGYASGKTQHHNQHQDQHQHHRHRHQQQQPLLQQQQKEKDHVVTIQINSDRLSDSGNHVECTSGPTTSTWRGKNQVTIVNLNAGKGKVREETDEDSCEIEDEVTAAREELSKRRASSANREATKSDLRLNICELIEPRMVVVQKSTLPQTAAAVAATGGVSLAVAPSTSAAIAPAPPTGTTSVTELNVTNASYLYYMVSSGQFSPCETLDSGTGSDLESSQALGNGKGVSSNGSGGGSIATGADKRKGDHADNDHAIVVDVTASSDVPKLEMHLKTTKIRINNSSVVSSSSSSASSSASSTRSVSVNSNLHERAYSLTDSEESESSSLSCDSLHSNDFVRQTTTATSADKRLGDAHMGGGHRHNGAAQRVLASFLPDSLLRDIRDRKFVANDFVAKYRGNDKANDSDNKCAEQSGVGSASPVHNSLVSVNGSMQAQLQQALDHERRRNFACLQQQREEDDEDDEDADDAPPPSAAKVFAPTAIQKTATRASAAQQLARKSQLLLNLKNNNINNNNNNSSISTNNKNNNNKKKNSNNNENNNVGNVGNVGTFIDPKCNVLQPCKYEADKYYNFHVKEHDNFRSFGNGSNGSSGGGLSLPGEAYSIAEFDTKNLSDEDAFAGYKDIRCGSASSTIRSSKGTVRGVKNRVRNGIATFLQLQQPSVKNYKEKDLGKVVLYTTSMGIIRDTYAKCTNVKKILRTLLIKFEERDVFMSIEYQQEIRERMHSQLIRVPQLFVEGQHIGDAETVERLNESGELRQLLKPYKSITTTYTCQTCGGYRLLPCPSCNGSKKSVHRNHFTAEFVALKCMNCDEVGLVKCDNC